MSPELVAEWTPHERREFARRYPQSWKQLQYRLEMAEMVRMTPRIDAAKTARRAKVLNRIGLDRARHRCVLFKLLCYRARLKRDLVPGASKDIIALAAEAAGHRVIDITSMSRTRSVVDARMAAAWLIKRHCGASSVDIGRRLGNRNHTTILHSLRVVDTDMMARGGRFGAIVKYVEDRLR